jgi:hypothetical protein
MDLLQGMLMIHTTKHGLDLHTTILLQSKILQVTSSILGMDFLQEMLMIHTTKHGLDLHTTILLQTIMNMKMELNSM